MNRTKLLALMLLAIAAIVAGVFFWNPGAYDLPTTDPEDQNVVEDDLEQAVADGTEGGDANGRSESLAEAGAPQGPAAIAAARGGEYRIRAVGSDGAATPGAKFLIENRKGEVEWVSSDSGILNLPDFSAMREVAALAGGMWSEPKSLRDIDGTSVDLVLKDPVAAVDLEISRDGNLEPQFRFYYDYRDRPQDLGETIAAVFQTNDGTEEEATFHSNLFHKAFRVSDPWDPVSDGRNGSIQLRELPPGFYNFRATSEWGVPESETVEVKAGDHQTVTLALQTGGLISGRVLGPDGKPLERATVMYRPSENSLADAFSQRRVRRVLSYSYGQDARNDLAHTDADGRYTMGPVPAGEGIAAAGKEELLPTIVGGIVVDAGQSQELEDIELLNGHSVAILATSAVDGEVLEHATASWHVTGSGIGIIATTAWENGDPKDRDAEGRLILRNLPFERLTVRISAEGFAPTETDYLMPKESWRADGDLPVLEVSLQRGLQLRGTVRDALTGEPVADAEVVALEGEEETPLPGLMASIGASDFPTTESDEQGLFQFQDLRAGEYFVQVQHPKYAPMRSEPLELSQGFEPNIEIALRPGATLIAHYIGTDGNSEANRSVILVHLELGSTQTQTTDEDGMAYFEGLPAGNVQIATLPGDADPESVGQGNLDLDFLFAELIEGATKIVELGPGLSQCKLLGTMTRGGSPVANKSITLLGTSGLKATRTNDDGEFEFEELRAGDYTFFAGEQTSPSYSSTVTIELGTNSLSVELPEGGIRATVVNASDRKPIAGVTVTVTANNTRGGALIAATNNDGVATFEDLDPGEYQVNAGKAALPLLGGDDALGSSARTIQVGATHADVELALEAGATFKARILGTDGAPVSGANMYYLLENGSPLSGLAFTSSNSKGVVQLKGLPAGPGRIAVRHPEFGQAEIGINLTAGELSKQEIQLQTGATVYIQVTNESDENLPGVLAALEDSRGARTSWLFTLNEAQSFNQSYFAGQEQKLGPMAPGDYTLKLFRVGGKVVEYEVTIPADTPELHLRYAYNP